MEHSLTRVMHWMALTLFVCVAITDAVAPLHGVTDAHRTEAVTDYVVVFKRNASMRSRNDHIAKLEAHTAPDSESLFRYRFSIMNFEGYVARMTEILLRSVQSDNEVIEYVEVDGTVSINFPLHSQKESVPEQRIKDPLLNLNVTSKAYRANATCNAQSNVVWGLGRITQRTSGTYSTYKYESTGSNVNAYVLDTGIYTQHNEFGGRARFGASFVSGDDTKTDRNGHGTHCAGTIGGTIYGVAKDVNLIAVQVLSESGTGSMSGVIRGLEWVCNQELKLASRQCVISMSLSGGFYTAMNDAANAAVACGCTVVTAAGNDGESACSKSPASAKDVVTVGATNKWDARPYFSNQGSCVTVFAPGVNIKSAWIGNTNALLSISGTSMAAPHVAGAAARMIGTNGGTPGTLLSCPFCWIFDQNRLQFLYKVTCRMRKENFSFEIYSSVSVFFAYWW
eukprot:m.485787 g.485787  ORF g.485787 m.485787 type:complete len:452 (-) comp21738_c0_seq5:527-1882(-)